MDSYIIQVQARDELTFIIDKLMHTQAGRVYLLVPENSRIAQNVLNFRLLKREADSLNKEVVVVSSAQRVQNLALKARLQAHQETSELRASALPVPDTASQSLRPKLSDVVSPTPPLRPSGFEGQAPPQTTPRVEKRTKAKKPKSVDKKAEQISNFWQKKPSIELGQISRRSMPKLPKIRVDIDSPTVLKSALVSLVIISIGVGAVTFYFVLPKSKIYIKPQVDKIEFNLNITGDIDSSYAQYDGSTGRASLPVQIFEKSLETSLTAKATGEKEVREKATGIIRVYNSFSSSAQTLVKTTRFISEGGQLFRTIGTIVVPGAEVRDGKIVPSSTTVEVVAAEPGPEHNIGPSTFSIPGFKGTAKYLAFYGESADSMSGGEIGKVKVVTKQDFGALEEKVRTELEGGIKQSLEELLPQGFFIPDGAKSKSDVKIVSSAKVDDSAGEFTITGSVSTQAFAILKSDAELILAEYFQKNFPQKRPLEEGRELVYGAQNSDFSKGKINIGLTIAQNAAAVIDSQAVIDGVLGKEEGEVRTFLAQQAGIEEARVTFWPFWVSKIPSDPAKIEIVIN